MTARRFAILAKNEEAGMSKKYLVTLTDSEREALLALTKKGSVAARKLTRAHILLQADAHATDATIATALHIGTATVERTRKRFIEGGVAAALTEHPRPVARRSSMAKPRPHSSPGHVARRPMIAPAGRCNCWPISWSSSRLSRPFPTKPCAAH
jgi:Homeodomain-like domain